MCMCMIHIYVYLYGTYVMYIYMVRMLCIFVWYICYVYLYGVYVMYICMVRYIYICYVLRIEQKFTLQTFVNKMHLRFEALV